MSWSYYDKPMHFLTYDILKPLAFVVFFVLLAAYAIVLWHERVTPKLIARRSRTQEHSRKVAS